jgi:hypothetical protein
MEISVDDIDCFKSLLGKGRAQNDSVNKKREHILPMLLNTAHTDPRWIRIAAKLDTTLRSLYPGPVERMTLTQHGGRGNNHDFLLKMFLNDTVVFETKLEFKHNAKTIDAAPQYLSLAAKYTKISYAEYFYDNYMPELCSLHPKIIAPSRFKYLKHVHQPNYDAHPFFQTLYDLKKSNKTVANNLIRISNVSIQKFLELYGNTLNHKEVIAHIKTTQQDKTFLLWDLDTFKIDNFLPEELDIVGPIDAGSKSKNTIVLGCKNSKSTHHMLLRWRNNLCVLFPAWQIKLSRSAGKTRSQS